MMQTLRKYMKHVMWIVAVTFIATIIFSWGMGGFKQKGYHAEQGVIGSVNGQKIFYSQFINAINYEMEKTKKEANMDEISESRLNSVREEVWQTMVREILFSQEVKRLRIQSSESEIIWYMENNPPDFIRSNEQFQVNGKFDIQKYRQALQDPENDNAWISVENFLRNALPVQKLQQLVISTVRVTDAEAKEAYRMENERINVKYLLFDPNKVTLENMKISEKEMKDYFQKHKNEYLEPEKRKIQYVIFDMKPTREDSLQIRNDIMDLLNRIKEGADFAEMAKEYSEDQGSASKGGDLGFFKKGSMVKPFEDAVFSARVGELIGPIETQFGLHLIQVLARKVENGETKIQACHILMKYKTSPETRDIQSERTQYFYEEVAKSKGKSFAELAKQEGLTIKETPEFVKGTFIPGIGIVPRISYFAFLEEIGWVSQPITTDNNDIIIFRISGKQKEHVKYFDEVKSSIQRTLENSKRKDQAGKTCQLAWEKAQKGSSLDELAREYSLPIIQTGLFTLQSNIPQLGNDPKFAGSAFKLERANISTPVEGTRGYYLLQLVDRTEINDKIFETEKEMKKQMLLQQKQNAVYSAWLTALKENANIKDYRNQYF